MARSISFALLAPRSEPADEDEADFPGCESFRLPESEIDRYEGRLELWDGYTETAWKVCEPTSIQHEGPSRRLVRVAERVASLRGSRIVCFGSADLVRLDAAGRKRWLMQADEVCTCIRTGRDADGDLLPDVVLEVDHTTDMRRRKLEMYKESGFSGDLGAGAVGVVGARAGADDPHAPGGLVSRGGGEPGVSGVEGGGDPPCADGGAVVGGSAARAGTGGPGDGRPRGHDTRGRPVHTVGEIEGRDKGALEGAWGCRARGATGSMNRCRLGLHEGPGTLWRTSHRVADGSGAGVYRRGRLPKTRPGGGAIARRGPAGEPPRPDWRNRHSIGGSHLRASRATPRSPAAVPWLEYP